MLTDAEDAYGHLMYDYWKTGEGVEIIERDDGFVDVSGGAKSYFTEYEDWPPHEQEALGYARGRVLDIGAGAGRHALYLQGQGHDVLGVDVSPLAQQVCRERGLRHTELLSVTQLSVRLGTFDTILMMGNNFGLFGSPRRARWLLPRFRRMTSAEGRIIAESNDPYQTELPQHLEYQAFNRARGRMSGGLRLRVRYKQYVSPWFDYLIVSQEEMEALLEGTAWRVEKFLPSEGSMYIAVLEKR